MSFNIRSSLQGNQGEEDKDEDELMWSQDDKAGSGATGRAMPLRTTELDIGALSSLLSQIGRTNSVI